MDMDRRQLFSGSLGLGAGLLASTAGIQHAEAAPSSLSTGLLAESLGVRVNSGSDQTRALQNAINRAAAANRPLLLPAGRISTGALTLPAHCHLVGIPGNTELSFRGGSSLLTCQKADSLILEGLTLTGNSLRLKNELVLISHVKKLLVSGCTISHALKNGLSVHHSGGRITGNEFHDITESGLFCQNSTGLEISNNHVHHCANNGIQVWRNRAGHDGTMVTNNRVDHIRADRGGDGPWGNGINIYKADNVMVSNNHISHCRFSAVRNNSSSNCQMTANHCTNLGEVALYVEFAFEGAVVANNLVDTAGSGISVTNFKEGGRLATVSGNLVRNIRGSANEKGYGSGIGVEADTIVSGNVIEGVRDDGIAVGWGKYVRDIIVSANLIRQCKVGIGITGEFGAGYLTVNNNMISATKKGAIRAKNYSKYIGPDLARKSAESYRNFAIFSNVARR